jgi:hypothetical protein
MKPARSFIERRTNVAAPPVSGSAEVASAYESATSRKSRPAPRRTSGVKPSAWRAMTPRAK